jgi:hypothetical protein
LKDVNPSIRNSIKISYILAYQKKIVEDLRNLNRWCQGNEQFSASEREELSLLQKNLLQKGNDSLDELTLVITPSNAEMKDDERLERIDGIYTEMRDRYIFVQTLNDQAKSLALSRSKALHEINVRRAFY